MPVPHEANLPSRYDPTTQDYKHYNFRDEPVVYPDPDANAKPIKIPVFHCEIEGNRAFFVCEVASGFSDLIPGGLCKAKFLGIPIGKIICKFLEPVLSLPLVLALGAAWAAGSDDNRDYQGAGTLKRGDLIVITGRWVYDAAHGGQNELHAVKTIQKLNDFEIYEPGKFEPLWHRFCALAGEVPPITDPGVHPLGMTPAQQTVHDNQRKPENRWYLHPFIDGCEPPTPPPPPPPPIH